MTGEPIRVTLAHVRQVLPGGHRVTCAPGIRAWCERHQVDLRALARDGLPVEQVEAIPDAFAKRAAALARAEAARG